MFDIIGIGTVLIDFTSVGVSGNGNPLYECNPGGSVANFLTAVSRQGGHCGIISKLGNDMFGKFLTKNLQEDRINVAGMVYSPDKLTTGAFVQRGEDGENDFLYYKKDAADTDLSKEEINYHLIDECKALHITSFIMTGEKSYESVLACIRYAKKAGKYITYDINWRPVSWDDLEEGKRRVYQVIRMTDILKVSLEELEIFSKVNGENWEEGAKRLLELGPKLILITFGSEGCAYYSKLGMERVEGEKVKVVDTTGAGDCCFGVFVENILKAEMCLEEQDSEVLLNSLKEANHAAALCVQNTGGIPSIPYGEGYDK